MVNILPASYRRQQILRSRLLQWGSMIVLVLVGGWAWHWLEMRQHMHLTQRLDVLSREHAPTQTMLKQVVDMRRQLKELEQQEAVAKELETQRNALTLLGVISETAQKTGGRLRVTRLELKDFQAVGKSTGAGPGAAPAGLLLAGVSTDNSAVQGFLKGLQGSGIFNKVECLKVKQHEEHLTSMWDYEVRCEF
jgi:Tfp pilus assembly protein PilN